jgi:GT2 family glycosyltransferase
VIIPTKNRAEALCHAVQTLCAQTAAFDQLIIVDQSVEPEANPTVAALVETRPTAELQYIHDRRPTNAGIARNIGISRADADVCLFLDDDVGLEREFLEELLAVYEAIPHAAGVCGIITNYSPPSVAMRVWERCFALGPFFDERQRLYWKADRLRKSEPVPVTKFTGALMSFRSADLREVCFDERIAAAGEDSDLSLRIGMHSLLLLAPKARLAHYRNPVNRSTGHWLKRYSETQHFLYRKFWSKSLFGNLAYGWLTVGCLVAATLSALRRLNLSPFHAFVAGIRTGEEWFRQPAAPAYLHILGARNAAGRVHSSSVRSSVNGEDV